MNTLSKVFENQKVLIPYITLGDPSIEISEQLVISAFDSGAGIVELGIPFSDPVSDGPVIQASHQRAIENKPDISLQDAFLLRKRVKESHDQPVVFMLSVNLVFQHGIERFFDDCAQFGVEGVVIPDLPVEEADIYIQASKKSGVAIIFLVSHLCSVDRMEAIVKASEGFVYLISSVGVTGERAVLSSDLGAIVTKMKSIKEIPIAVGFGISSKEHVDYVFSVSDGAIVGSYLVKHLHQAQDPVTTLKDHIQKLL